MVVILPKFKNPSVGTNILSQFSFAWFLPTVIKAYKRPLTEDDLFKLHNDHQAKALGDRLENSWEEEMKKRNPSLFKAIIKAIGPWSIFFYSLGGNVLDFTKISQVVILIRLLSYLSLPREGNEGHLYLYAGLLAFCSLFIATTQHLYTFTSKLIGMKIRVALCSLLYRKALKLSKKSLNTCTGPLLNLMGNDVSRFDLIAISLNHMYSTPLLVTISLAIMYFEVGWTGCIGVGIISIFIPFQLHWAKMVANYKGRIASYTDERLRLTNEIVSGIQVIKMYGWEAFFYETVMQIRSEEIKLFKSISYVASFIYAMNHIVPEIPLLAAILTYAYLGNILTPRYVYALVAFYNILKGHVIYYLPQAILNFADNLVTVERCEKYLFSEEVSFTRTSTEKYTPLNPKNDAYKSRISVRLTEATASWGGKVNVLQDITMKIPNSRLIAIIGPVGSGKSSLLNILLKELPLISGEIEVKGRISYASQEPWLFLGTIRENILFGQPYNEEVYKKIIKVCALERDLSLFINGDLTLVRERGSNLSGGQKTRIHFARAIYKQSDVYLIDDPLAALDVHVGKCIFEECIKGYLQEKCVILVTNQLYLLKRVDYIYILQHGTIVAQGTYSQLRQQKVEVLKIVEKAENEKITMDTQFDDTFEYNDECKEQEDKEISNQKTSFKLYKTYLDGGGGLIRRVMLIAILLTYQPLPPTNNYFISHWSSVDRQFIIENATLNTTYTRNEYMAFFISITSILVVVATTSAIGSFTYFVQCNNTISKKVFSKVIAAPMTFFQMNPSGRILNRFARDLGIIDHYISAAMMDVVDITLQIVQIMILVVIANPWLFPAVIVVIVFTYAIRFFYLPSCFETKRIEAVMRSPTFSYLRGTFEGLATIRAYKEQNTMKTTFDNLLDVHTSTWYMYLASTHSFGVAIDGLCAIFLTVVTFSFLITNQDVSAANAGLAITQSLVLIETVQWMMRQWNELETNMTSMERLVEYLDIEEEGTNDKRDADPKPNWGEQVSIEFKNVFLKYDLTSAPVLKNINVKIKAGQKIGIVGRTGAGKSSIAICLFQLAYCEGLVLIDEVDISKVPLRVLRSKISIIPQEPVLFTTTLRENLDPFNEHDDVTIWTALSKVELQKAVSHMSGGLRTHVSAGGSNFSVGQRQLLCLARAILKRTKILIMDEATANVDSDTDALIQKTVRDTFKSCTVLTVAHRLNTIIDSDRILVMAAGEVVECDHPHILLNNKGLFFEMVEKTGAAMCAHLHNSAKIAYMNSNSD